ncbi:MAG: ScyD/ScyE family protein [Opitutaceae bacterium]
MKMLPKRLLFVLAIVATTLTPIGVSLKAATLTPLTTGLLSPAKITLSTKGNLLVTEVGFAPNSGRVSLVDPATGVRRTLLDGLPSGLATPNNDPAGPSALWMRGRTLYVAIGTGDEVVNGPAPGTAIPNPHPSSPLFSSVLAVHFSANVENTTSGFRLSMADQAALKAGSLVTCDNGAGDKLTIELVADFADYVPDPRPNQLYNVRASNPFGIAAIGERLFVVDASMNNVRTVDLDTGLVGTLATFGPLPNTRGFGPPVVEAVPDSIRVFGDQLLVTLLSGYPFPIGAAQVRLLDPETGVSAPLITGLTSAIDVLPLDGGFFTLEYTSDMLVAPPPAGRVLWFAAPGATPVLVNNTLNTPTNLVFEPKTGSIFITEIFTGRIMKLSP